MEASKVEAVQKIPTPKTKKDVRTFLGLKGYYRKYIPIMKRLLRDSLDCPCRVCVTRGEGECVCVCGCDC